MESGRAVTVMADIRRQCKWAALIVAAGLLAGWQVQAAPPCGTMTGPSFAAVLGCHAKSGMCSRSNPANRTGDTRSDDPVPDIVGSPGIPEPAARVDFAATSKTVGTQPVSAAPPAYKRFCAYLE